MIDPAALANLGELPLVVAALFVVLGALWRLNLQTTEREIKLEQIRAQEREAVEALRASERQTRDDHWRSFLQAQRELDRTLGTHTAAAMSSALDKVSDSMRDNGTAIVTAISQQDVRMSKMEERLEGALDAFSAIAQATNHQLALISKDVQNVKKKVNDEGQS